LDISSAASARSAAINVNDLIALLAQPLGGGAMQR